ncbi:hypothetical protein Clacol_004263 [Clathrus columnatus]|uniref:Uncharacterized protein n=1 Tax=Clathrus columnatus TaxID=1419009 RepID=A0AAV5A606_9AGAM|nr:hypothetical protein Clacol_004263 [Clathrus columnatus]
MATRSSSLRVFEFDVPFKRNHVVISHSLGESMSSLQELMLVYLPTHFMTPALFKNMSRLPNFKNLTLFTDSKNSRFGTQYVEANIKRTVLTGNLPSFHSLRELNIADNTYRHTFTIFDALERSMKLAKLAYLTCFPQCEGSDKLTALMEAIPIVCPNLLTITITVHGPTPHLHSQAIHVLLKCPRLHKLDSHRMADLSMEDIVTIATNRTTWQILRLPSSNPLSLEALVPFARNCPDLVMLGLTLDGDLPFSASEAQKVRFSSLKTLNVRFSMLTAPIEAGIFFSTICDGPLKINSDRKCASLWKTVEKIVNATDEVAMATLVQSLNRDIVYLQDSVSKLESMKVIKFSGLKLPTLADPDSGDYIVVFNQNMCMLQNFQETVTCSE